MIRTLSTTLLQIFCKIIPNSKSIVKSTIDPDDNSWMNSEVLMVNVGAPRCSLHPLIVLALALVQARPQHGGQSVTSGQGRGEEGSVVGLKKSFPALRASITLATHSLSLLLSDSLSLYHSLTLSITL